MFNQDVTFSLPDAEPDEEPPTLKVKVKQNNYLRFDKCVRARGSQEGRDEGEPQGS